jgi:hypothetical protein
VKKRRRKMKKIMRVVWAIFVLSILLAYSCASMPKGGVPFEGCPKCNSMTP